MSSTISGDGSLAACTAKEEEDEGTNASCAARDVVSLTSTPATDPDDVDESWGLNRSCLWWCLRSILGNITNIIRRHRVPQSVLTAVLPIDPLLMGFPIKRAFCNAPFALSATLFSNYTRHELLCSSVWLGAMSAQKKVHLSNPRLFVASNSRTAERG